MAAYNRALRTLRHVTDSPQHAPSIAHAPAAATALKDDDVVILSAVRTPIGKAKRGSFKDTPPDDLLSTALKAAVERAGIKPGDVQDVCVGNVLADQAALMARTGQLLAGIPETVPVSSVNRQCSSGLQACMNIAGAIRSGSIEIGIGAGVESMSAKGMDDAVPQINPRVFDHDVARNCLTPMGVTSENVAEKFSVTRDKQDKFAAESHALAARAQTTGRFDAEIVPTLAIVKNENGDESTLLVSKDDGVRAETTAEGLSKLKPSFKKGGTTTAGNASQVSDGAAAVVLASVRAARRRGLTPLAVIRSYAVVGVAPEIMGIGPALAIPAALAQAGLKVADIDIFELNEAFASQAVYCAEELKIPREKLNPNGGAIALGHPLGCTGARQIATLVHELRRSGKTRGVVSMCIGTGMGAAAVVELV